MPRRTTAFIVVGITVAFSVSIAATEADFMRCLNSRIRLNEDLAVKLGTIFNHVQRVNSATQRYAVRDERFYIDGPGGHAGQGAMPVVILTVDAEAGIPGSDNPELTPHHAGDEFSRNLDIGRWISQQYYPTAVASGTHCLNCRLGHAGRIDAYVGSEPIRNVLNCGDGIRLAHINHMLDAETLCQLQFFLNQIYDHDLDSSHCTRPLRHHDPYRSGAEYDD